jgi:hypothetical protein
MTLSTAVHELTVHLIDLDEFTQRLLSALVYTLCPVCPGLFVMSRPGGAAIVPVWSTTRALRQGMGNYDWSARTGEDLVDQLPPGVGILVDAGMPCPVEVPPSVLACAKVISKVQAVSDHRATSLERRVLQA